jgi:DNA helicase-2/ATP-dependent DNA helicase PcrA
MSAQTCPGFTDDARHHMMIAGAGAGKTTFLVDRALNLSGYTLITTYTIRNSEEIKTKIRELNHGIVPGNIDVLPWDTFLLQHGSKPFRRSLRFSDGKVAPRISGMILVNSQAEGAPRGVNSKQYGYYMTSTGLVYSDKLANYVCQCDDASEGAVIKRIIGCYDRIYIDEVQDLAGYDLEIVNRLLHQTQAEIVMAGDPRQFIFRTHWEKKNQPYNTGKIDIYISDKCGDTDCSIDYKTLNRSYRCRPELCSFSSQLYKEFPPVYSITEYKDTNHDGVFLVKEEDVDDYIEKLNPVQLRWNASTKVKPVARVLNMGEAKGTTFDRVLIYPTADMLKWVLNHDQVLTQEARAKFYVALTRARYSVGIVCKMKNVFQSDISDIQKYER